MTVQEHFTVLYRNFPTGPNTYQRLPEGSYVEISVRISGVNDLFQVRVTSDLFSESGRWETRPLELKGEGLYSLVLPLESQGRYAFRLMFSGDGGKNWNLDKVDYSYIAVHSKLLKNLRFYTLIPNASGSFADWIKRLPAIQSMGFNVIQVLPLTLMDRSQSPYSAARLREIDPGYGDPRDSRPLEEQFADFSRAVAELGMMLCLDLVLNHLGIQSELVKRHPDWILADLNEPDGLKRAGWWKGTEWMKWDDIVLIHYDHPNPQIRREIWNTMAEYCHWWAQKGCPRGGVLRLDNFHSSHQGFVHFMLDSLRKKNPHLIILAELFDEEANIHQYVKDQRLDLLLGTEWEEPFVPQLRRLLEYMHSDKHSFQFFTPVNSHDSGTPAQEFGHQDALFPRYAAASLLGMGFTGIVQGVEWGNEKQLSFMGPQRGPVSEGVDLKYADYIAKLNQIIDSHPEFGLKGNLEFMDQDHAAILGALRKGPSGEISLVLINFDHYHPHTIETKINFGNRAGETRRRLRDLVTGQIAVLAENSAKFTLPPCTCLVYRLEQE